ncbi:MAG TPA: hypothetical protein PLD59_12350, partial [Tepidisphaeraceae bacterium]|nr:hypothetical protein [Tepidisphaeraceae bacterium]
MTNAPSSSSSQQPGYEPAATPPQVTARRTLLQQTLRDTFTRPGARIGVVWITILATVGIFAPLLANSAPLLIKEKATGAISSPVLSTLRPSDITLAVIYVVTITLLLWKRFSLGQSIVMILAAGLLAFLPSFLLIKSQDAPVYERYRLNEAAGQYEWVVRTIVPFSPNDRVNDVSGTKLKSPSGRHWLGTSIFGEDVLSRMMYACRVALTIGLISTGIAVTIGIF